ncbi:MAG: MFS transporter [Anaerolineae bacterium]|nr:MFS transporter [Anaerolineae bacterium]
MTWVRARLTEEYRPAWLFLAYIFVFHIGVLGVADVVLNFYFVSIGADQEAIGWLQGIPRLAGLLTSVPVGLVTARIGSQRVMIFSTLAIAVVYFMYVGFPSLAMLAVARFLLGVFYGAQQIAMVPYMIALVRPDQQTRFFAYQNVVAMAGMALGGIAGGFLPAWLIGLAGPLAPELASGGAQTPFAYGSALIVCGLLTILSVLPFLWMGGRTPLGAKPRKRAQGEKRVRLRWGLLLLLTVPMISFGFAGGLTFPFYNLFFRETFALPDSSVGIVLSLGWIGMALVPLANPWWERRYGRPWSIFIVMVIAAAAFVMLGAANTLILGVASYVTAASFRNVMQPLYQPLLMNSLPPDQHAMASSMSGVLWNLGWFGATAISATMLASGGYSFLMYAVAVAVLLCGASTVLIFRHRVSVRENPALAV